MATETLDKPQAPDKTSKKDGNSEQKIFKQMRNFFKDHAPKKAFLMDIKDVGYPLERYRINWWRSSEKGAYIALSYYVFVNKKSDDIYSFNLAKDCLKLKPIYRK